MNRLPTRPTVGPRGGRAIQPTPCSECVSYLSCRPAACSEPYGCESWVNEDGRRALPDELEPDHECIPEMCPDCNPLPDPDLQDELEPVVVPSVEDAYAISDAVTKLKRLFETPDMAYRVAVAGAVDILSNPDPAPEPFRPAAPFVPDPSRGEATAQACLEMPDSGPLFAGCLEVRR